jgi:aspartyl-tRNA(Asn)/glutamyl-tRNA(Gln) amidotransferase subunit A
VATAGRADMEQAASTLRAILALDQAIVLPTTPQAAFAHGGDVPVSQADFTALANIAGLPALALPAGWTADGLPVSVQLMGRPGQERALLALGERLEAALNAWRPPAQFD